MQPAGAPPFGPLSFRIVARAPSQPFVHDLALDADGEVALPPIPASYAFVEALTGRGVRVWNGYLPAANGRRATDAAREPRERDPVPAVHEMSGEANELSTLRLPTPTPVAFTVADADGPVADAEILIGAQTSAGSISDVHDCRVITRTDASGEVTLPMYLSWNEAGELAGSSPDVVVRSDRHHERMFRMLSSLRGERADPTRAMPKAHVTLTGPTFTAAGTLLLAPGEPARGVPVLLYDAYSTGNATSQSNSTKPIVTTTDAAGAFAFPGRVPGRQYRLTALLQVDAPTGREEVYLANSEAAKAPGEHGALIASELVHIDFQITTQNGSPADRARIYLAEERSRPRTPVTYLTDRSGRCSVRVPREQLLNVIVASDDGFAAARLPHPGEAARVAQSVQLKIGATLTGVAVDTDGAPLADVRVSISDGDKVHDWYATLLNDVSNTTYALDYRGTYTDADGRFRAVFPEAGIPVRVTAWRNGADGRYMQMVGDRLTIELAATANEPLRLVLDDWKSR